MKVFTEKSFGTLPAKDGFYTVIRKDGEQNGFDYTVGHGWNCKRLRDGNITGDEYVITVEDMKERHTCWLEPYTIGSEEWFYTLLTMKEEVKNRILDYSDTTISEEEQDGVDALDELYSLITTAMDFAERFK